MSQEQQINEMYEIVVYLRDNMIMKKDFDKKIVVLRDGLVAHTDSIVKACASSRAVRL